MVCFQKIDLNSIVGSGLTGTSNLDHDDDVDGVLCKTDNDDDESVDDDDDRVLCKADLDDNFHSADEQDSLLLNY